MAEGYPATQMLEDLPQELKQPLTAIAASTNTCRRLLAKREPDIQEINRELEQIKAQAVRTLKILHRLRKE